MTAEKAEFHWSDYCSLMECPSAYGWRSRGITRDGYSSALAIGHAVHAALEHADTLPGIAVDIARQEMTKEALRLCHIYDTELLDKMKAKAESDTAMAVAMVTAYRDIWSPGPHINVLQAEAAFNIPLKNPASGWSSHGFTHAGRIDGLVTYRDEGTLVLERKTTGDKVDEFERKMRVAMQPDSYIPGAESLLGRTVDGVLLDIIGKPRLRRKKTETAEDFTARLIAAMTDEPWLYFRRTVLPRDASRIREWRAEAWRATMLIRWYERHGYPKPLGPHCHARYGRTCSFFSLCSTGSTEGYYTRDSAGNTTPLAE